MVVIRPTDMSMSTERERIGDLKRAIDEQIKNISDEVTNLKTSWQDEKSGKLLADLETNLEQLKTQVATVETNVEQYFNDIIEQVKIYASM